MSDPAAVTRHIYQLTWSSSFLSVTSVGPIWMLCAISFFSLVTSSSPVTTESTSLTPTPTLSSSSLGSIEAESQAQPSITVRPLADPRLIVYPGDLNVALLVNSHKSSASGQCSDQINLPAVRSAMAAIWAIHQINVNQVATGRLKLGLYLYDTCSDSSVSERQAVRILAHLDDIQSKTCLKDRESPLIGIISSGQLFQSTLNLFTSFQVPILTTEERDPMENSESTLFTVAPSLKYLSKAVMGLLNKLNWSTATLVVSDEVPLYYTKVLEDIAHKVRFNVQNSPVDSTVDYSSEPEVSNSKEQASRGAVKNTILFLSPEETLKLFSSLRSLVAPESDEYDWIVVTSQDVLSQVKMLYGKRPPGACHTKPVYLILPQQETTPELSEFLTNELSAMGDSIDPLFRELLESAHKVSNESYVPATFSSIIKSVWSYGLALRSYESKHCSPKTGGSLDCSPGLGSSLVRLIQSEIQSLNSTINESGFKSLNGFRLNFDDEHYLSTNRYGLKAITANCQILDMGYFEDGVLINRESRSHFNDGDSASFNGHSNDSPNFISVSKNEDFFESEAPDRSKSSAEPQMFKPKPTRSEEDVRDYENGTKVKELGTSSATLGRPYVKPLPSDYVLKLRPLTTSIDRSEPSKSSLESKSIITGRSTDSRSSISDQPEVINGSPGSPNILTNQKIERNSIVRNNRFTTNYDELIRKRYNSFYSWLGHSWTVTIISLNVIGILISLYTFTYILMKSCEGALKKSNQDLATFHILSIIIVYFGSVLYVFPPTSMMCLLRSSLHNISCTMLFGSLLQRGMYLRAQKWIGLGGKISKLNQCLTLLFIIGVQLALEIQRWSYESLQSNETFYRLPKEHSPNSREYILSRSYLLLISCLLLLVAWSARHQPFAFKDGKHIFITSVIIFPVYLGSILLADSFSETEVRAANVVAPTAHHHTSSQHSSHLAPHLVSADRLGSSGGSGSRSHSENYAIYQDIITSFSMIFMASASLFGIFGPIIYTIQKYGILPPKNGSYAESLSTAFTLFRGLEGSNRDSTLLDRFSNVDTSSNTTDESISRTTTAKGKTTKRADIFPYFIGPTNNFKLGLKPGLRDRPCPFGHCHSHLKCSFGECSHIDKGLIKNPLYDDQGFRSAYP